MVHNDSSSDAPDSDATSVITSVLTSKIFSSLPNCLFHLQSPFAAPQLLMHPF